MGFINKNKVASVISLGGVCSGLAPCSQVGAMEMAPIEFETDGFESGEKKEDLFDCFKKLLGDVGKSNLNKIMFSIEKSGDGNFDKMLAWLKGKNNLIVLADFLNKLDKNGSSVFSKMINEISDNGTANLYLVLSEFSVAGVNHGKCSASDQFAKLLNSLDDVGAINFALILGRSEQDNYIELDKSLISAFGVDCLVSVLKELDDQGIYNIAVLLKQNGSSIAKVFVRVLNNLSQHGITNFSKIIKALSVQGTSNFIKLLVGKNLDINKLVEKINYEKFKTEAFVEKLNTFGENIAIEDFIDGQKLGSSVIENYF